MGGREILLPLQTVLLCDFRVKGRLRIWRVVLCIVVRVSSYHVDVFVTGICGGGVYVASAYIDVPNELESRGDGSKLVYGILVSAYECALLTLG